MVVKMIPLIPFVCVAYFILYVFARSVPAQAPLLGSAPRLQPDLDSQLSLDAWIARQAKTSLEKLLDNVAPGGKNTKGAAPGTVIASPSRSYPDYYFQWIRDAGITLSTLVDIYSQNTTSELSNAIISPILESYAKLSTRIQHTPNPSGTFRDLASLGEPKFLVTGAPFTGSWGRPQRDGPALRATTLMAYIRAYNASHPALWTVDRGNNPFADLYDSALPAHSVVKADLEYVAHYWRAPGFDLWEEIQGLHFFTAMVQLRALREGASVAVAFNDPGAARFYQAQAQELEELVRSFWSDERGHLVETLDSHRSGLDCGLLLGAIHGSSAEDMAVSPFPPYSDEILVSLLELVKDQRYRFPINSVPQPPEGAREVDELAGVGIGRYPEDVYDGYGTSPAGGNPWFLCTSSVAEVLYHTAMHLKEEEALSFEKRGLPFWDALLPKMNIEAGKKYDATSEEYQAALKRLHSVGDAFLAVVRKHTAADGALSEQFDRYTGYERGATDLTWSYGAFLQAIEVRKKMLAV